MNTMNNGVSMGGMNTMGNGAGMGGMTLSVSTPAAANDDDFGDFEDAAPKQASVAVSTDPLAKLISLDGLKKNPKKEDKTAAPIVFNSAAAQYLYDKKSGIQATNPAMSFQGIDGLNKVPTNFNVASTSNLQPGQSVMGGSGMLGAGVAAGGADAIAMMGPQSVMPQQQQKPVGMQMQQGMQQMTPQMQQQMMMMMQQQQQQMRMQGMNNTMGGMQGGMGMANPGMMQGGMGGMQGNMGGMQGGMPGNMGMMGGNMNGMGGQQNTTGFR
mmetsp:Transcript_12851/g.18495  ORF Transcript_12851/g.18495 Transcript_12851/m.18495 type:complete len:269 (+) Transcript_12851:1-807(+)